MSVLDKYAVRFIPRENGLYLIDVKFNGSHIPGSPFKMRIGETGQAGDPGMVSAYGPGLEGGTTGTKVSPSHNKRVSAHRWCTVRVLLANESLELQLISFERQSFMFVL